MHIYLAASIPRCVLGQPPPMTLAAFQAACSGVLPREETEELDRLLFHRLPECRTRFGRAYAALSIQIWNEVAGIRAQKLQAPRPSPELHPGYSLQVRRLVHEAFTRDSPLDLEWTLDRGRWDLVEDLVPVHRPLGLERVLAFGVHLVLMHRWAGLEAGQGREKLNSLVNGTVREALRPFAQGTQL